LTGETLMNTNGTALAEGLYWYAEKLLWGYGRWNRTSAFVKVFGCRPVTEVAANSAA